jgi:hypothetical protein
VAASVRFADDCDHGGEIAADRRSKEVDAMDS